jgi:hypothetical protein
LFDLALRETLNMNRAIFDVIADIEIAIPGSFFWAF